MKEIKVNIPENSKTVTVKIDGENIITEFEPKEKEWNPQDGDFVTDELGGTVAIYADTNFVGGIVTYAGYLGNNLTTVRKSGWGMTMSYRPATEEEKRQLIDRLAKEGLRWNAEEKKLEPLPRWRAEKYGDYYSIYSNGCVIIEKEEYCEFDTIRYNLGNYFKTKEAAERVAEQIRDIFKNSKAE